MFFQSIYFLTDSLAFKSRNKLFKLIFESFAPFIKSFVMSLKGLFCFSKSKIKVENCKMNVLISINTRKGTL